MGSPEGFPGTSGYEGGALSACKQTVNSNVLIHIGPVNAITLAVEFPANAN